MLTIGMLALQCWQLECQPLQRRAWMPDRTNGKNFRQEILGKSKLQGRNFLVRFPCQQIKYQPLLCQHYNVSNLNASHSNVGHGRPIEPMARISVRKFLGKVNYKDVIYFSDYKDVISFSSCSTVSSGRLVYFTTICTEILSASKFFAV